MDIYEEIIQLYKEYGTINAVKDRTGKAASKIKIQRVLITEGLWSSRTSEAVGQLHEQGKTSEEIARELFMSVKNVQSYLPYTRGVYGESSSGFSKASSSYRKRNELAVQKMKKKGKDNG